MGATRVSRGGLRALKLSTKAQVAGFRMRAASGCCPVGDVMAARRPLCCALAARWLHCGQIGRVSHENAEYVTAQEPRCRHCRAVTAALSPCVDRRLCSTDAVQVAAKQLYPPLMHSVTVIRRYKRRSTALPPQCRQLRGHTFAPVRRHVARQWLCSSHCCGP